MNAAKVHLVLIAAMGLLAGSSGVLRAQPLIMLLVGDKIASEDFVGGITAGITLTDISNVSGSQPLLSWSFGAALHWRLTHHWHFAPEVYFKNPGGMRGSSGVWTSIPSVDSVLSDRREWLSTSYVSIPLLVKYRVGMFYILAGPQISYLVAATDNISGTTPEGASVQAEKSAFGRLNRWDVGMVVGTEVLLVPQYGINSVRIGVRYYQGVADVTTGADVISRNSGFSMGVGIPIGGSTAGSK
jgi:hypothetical protein